MSNTALSTKECLYQRFLGITWESNQGIDPSVVTPEAGFALAELFAESLDDRPLYVYCEGMRLCMDHSMHKLVEVMDFSHRLIIFGIPRHDSNFEKKLLAELGEPANRIEMPGLIVLSYAHTNLRIDERRLSRIVGAATEKEIDFVQELVSSCYRRFADGKRRLTSTPLLADGVFNARNLISNKKGFMWISLILAERTRARIMAEYPDNIFILAISLRGSPLAAAVWNLLRHHDPYIEIIDHIGPIHELLEDGNSPLEIIGKNYFLIGDFIVGGTELKVASAFAVSHQSTLNSAAFIGALLDGNQYSDKIHIDAVVKLKDCVDDLDYVI